jgi:hypothetical protein
MSPKIDVMVREWKNSNFSCASKQGVSPQLKWTPLLSVTARPYQQALPWKIHRDWTEEPRCHVLCYRGQTQTVAKTRASVGPQTRYVSSVHFPLASHSQHIRHEPFFLSILFIHPFSFFWPPILCYCCFGHFVELEMELETTTMFILSWRWLFCFFLLLLCTLLSIGGRCYYVAMHLFV